MIDAGRVESEQPFGPVVLEDEHEHAVGGGDREQVEQDRLDRDHERAEGEQEDPEGEDEHERDHVGQPVCHLPGEVDVARGVAGDGDLEAGDGAERLRDQLAAQDAERVLARAVVAEPAQRQLERAGAGWSRLPPAVNGGWAMPAAAASVSSFFAACSALVCSPFRPGEDDDRGR